jgi:unsaturated chondroitin disaccharide hydrolase
MALSQTSFPISSLSPFKQEGAFVIEIDARADKSLLEAAMKTVRHQVRSLVENYPDFYPMYTRDGIWKHGGELWTHWCDGFLPGMMWIVYEHEATRQSPEAHWWREKAIAYSKPLEPRQFDRNVHDLGFIFMSTYFRWYDISEEPFLNDVLIQAGRTMSLRFREKGEYLRSFVSEDSLFIDIMMNIGIVFYAALETGDGDILDIAMRHCLTTRRTIVRGDGSTAHEGIFDLETGEFLKQTTHQGYRGDSCWTRGLAWSLYGFGTSYYYTRDPRFLETAEACADFFLENVPADGVAPWDFDAPEESRKQVDTSASAIAASGLFQLAELSADRMKGKYYEAAALHIVQSLCRHYVADPASGWEGILKGGVYHIHKNLGVNESVMFGEYFFVEALDKALSSIE